jgi:AraC family transcriptional activator of mtrCDE
MPRKKSIIEYRHYSLPIQFPVLLLSGERWRISDIKSEHLHFHNHLEIGVCHSDSGVMDIGESAVPFKAGDITCIPRYLPHTTYSLPGTASRWSYIFFSPEELFKGIFGSDAVPPVFSNTTHTNLILSKEEHPHIYTLATAAVEEIRRQDAHYQQSAYGLLLSLYTELLRLYELQKETDGLGNNLSSKGATFLSPVLEYIANHYMTPITVDLLAGLCHLSTTHFRRKFIEIMGASPLDFVNSTRIDEACKLLRSTEHSVISISEQVGFRSISSFNRCFSKLMGESPTTWRKKTMHHKMQSAKASILKFTGWI